MAGVASLEEDNEQLNVECSTGVCEVRGSYLFVITEECCRKLWAGFKIGITIQSHLPPGDDV